MRLDPRIRRQKHASRPKPPSRMTIAPAYKTPNGAMYCGKCEPLLRSRAFLRETGKAQLIFTSPPFVLNRKKKYGNLEGRHYVRWIASLADLFKRYVAPNGSIVIELGNAWEP